MTPEPPKARENRRPHRKSRNGCLVCKQRRVKCDEQRPQCRKCAFGDRVCSYQDSNRDSSLNVRSPDSTTAASAASTLHTSPAVHVARAEDVGGTFKVLHMSLLRHAHSSMVEVISLRGDMNLFIDTAIDSAYEAPYLLDQLLAISALHQSAVVSDPSMASMYLREATRLQNRALGSFNEVRENIPESHSIPAFIFATLLGIHVLHDTFRGPERSLSRLVADFVAYVRLHSGVRTVIDGYWPHILESKMQPLLYLVKWTEEPEALMEGSETAGLLRFLESSRHSPPLAAEACITAAKWVQWVLGVHAQEQSRTDMAVQATTSWPLLVPEEFIETLYQRRPEGLVVLAHYAALLHRFREFWIFGNFGAVLIKAITNHVGPFWAEALAWPQQVLLEMPAHSSPW